MNAILDTETGHAYRSMGRAIRYLSENYARQPSLDEAAEAVGLSPFHFQRLFTRYVGVNGSAYFVGGFGMTALAANNSVMVPIRSGVGLRLGANIGYLKFTPEATWNPF